MRRVKYLITAIRNLTENDGVVTDSAGISDDDIIQYINDAQDCLFEEIEQLNSDPFIREAFIDSVSNQEAYAMPPRVYMGHNLVSVEYSYTGQVQDYALLSHQTYMERDTGSVGTQPFRYFVRGGYILLNPIPTGSKANAIRVNYVQKLPRIDKRRGQLDSVTVSSGEVTALSLDITDYADYFKDATSFSDTSILVDDYFCIVGADGTIKARNIPITAINTTNGNATITSYTPESTSETAATGDYLVAGANSTTHSELPDMCEKYLIHKAAEQIFDRDGATASMQKQAMRVQQQMEIITEAWGKMSEDVQYVPVVNDEFLYG